GDLAAARTALEAAGSSAAARDGELAELRRQVAVAESVQQAAEGEIAGLRADLASASAELASLREAAAGTEEDLQRRLAAAIAARVEAEANLGRQMTEAERNAALLAESRARIAEGDSQSAEDARRLEVLNQQVAEM